MMLLDKDPKRRDGLELLAICNVSEILSHLKVEEIVNKIWSGKFDSSSTIFHNSSSYAICCVESLT